MWFLFFCAVASVAITVAILALVHVLWLAHHERRTDFMPVDLPAGEIIIFDIPRRFNSVKLRAYTKEEVRDANDLVYVGNGLYVWDAPAYVLDYIDFWQE